MATAKAKVITNTPDALKAKLAAYALAKDEKDVDERRKKRATLQQEYTAMAQEMGALPEGQITLQGAFPKVFSTGKVGFMGRITATAGHIYQVIGAVRIA